MSAAFVLGGLLVYAILTIWMQESWAWAGFQTGLFAVAAFWTAAALAGHRRLRGSLLFVPLGCVLLWGLGQMAARQTIYRWASWRSLLTWTTWGAAFFLAVQILGDAKVRRAFLRAMAIFGFILSTISTVQMFTSDGRIFWLFPSGYAEFVLGPFTNRNQYAAFVELLLPIALAEALRDKRRWFPWCAMAGGMFASVIASASRAGVVLAGLEITVVLTIAAVRGAVSRRIAAKTVCTFAALAGVFTLVVGWDLLWKRFTDPDPFAGRREMYISSLNMIRDRPWMGFGLGTWPTAYPRYALYDDGTVVNQAHNDWAQWTVEGGIPFLVILLALVIPAIPAAVNSLWGIGVLSVLAHGMVDYPFQQRPALGAWCFVLLGALAARARAGPRRGPLLE